MKTTLLTLVLISATWRGLAGNDAIEDYVAHEWGTFTSVQGADGVLLEWNPLETTKLPKFVYDWTKPGLDRRPAGGLNSGLKSRFLTLQRMETPVIYFYSDAERTVDVTVRFPQGLITEWYPQAQEIGPSAFPPNKLATALDGLVRQAGLSPRITFESLFGKKGIPDSRVHWSQLRVLPVKEHADVAAAIPNDEFGSHYFAARETDAAYVRVASRDKAHPAEREKFLFYRGVANFKTPLSATLGGGTEEWFQLRNTGTAELRHLFTLMVRNGRGRVASLDSLPPGKSWSYDFDGKPDGAPLDEVVPQLGRQVEEALRGEGLFEREAAAMVKTWRESWFEEEGVRVLYILPRAWTDETLPMTIKPAPREIVRVMVGRAEILPPATQWQLIRQIVRYADGAEEERRQAAANVRQLRLGRFLKPAFQLVLGANPSREFSLAVRNLLDAASKPIDAKPLAAK